MTARVVAQRTADAADDLLLWLESQRRAVPDSQGVSGPLAPSDTAGITATAPLESAALTVAGLSGIPYAPDRSDASSAAKPVAPPPVPVSGRVATDDTSALLRPAHTDWLHHRLTVTGPEDTLARFRVAARGTGIIPWRLDFDRMAEDFFLLLAAPPPPRQRTLSIQGARVLAGQLCAAVAQRQAAGRALMDRARVDREAALTGDVWSGPVWSSPAKLRPLDLHALVPVPDDILHLGSDHPDALAWLCTHWGTTQPLRHVAEHATPPRGRQSGAAPRLQFSFWSADWTPWQALAQVAAAWPDLRFAPQPSYEDP